MPQPATARTAGLWFGIDLGSGTNFNATAGIWAAAGTRTSGSVTFVNQIAGSTLNITGVQVEDIPTGSTNPSSFEVLPYSEQLFRCQRYLPVFNSMGATSVLGNAFTSSTTSATVEIPFPAPTRVAPTGITISAAAHFSFSSAAAFASSATVFGAYTNTTMGELTLTLAAATAGQGGRGYFNNAAGQLAFTGAQM